MSTLITLPAYLYWESVSSLKLQRAGLVMRSRYTGLNQRISFPFAMWTFEGTTLKMDPTDAAEWRAFLTQLDGTKNYFRLPVPGTEGGPISGFGGTAVVGTAGALAGAKTMPVTTTGAGATFLKRGDYFTVNDELKVCSATCSTGTNQTITFEPFLRANVTSGMTVTIVNPTIRLCAADFEQADWSLEHPVQHQIKLKAIEAVT